MSLIRASAVVAAFRFGRNFLDRLGFDWFLLHCHIATLVDIE